jgi:hypothetical protein
MASSFITKDNIHGFWVNDALMQVVCWGIVNVIDEIPSNDSFWVKGEFREHIFDNSQGIFIGFMNLGLREYLINQERNNLFNEILFEVRCFFKKKGDFIPMNELNDFQLIEETKREWISPLETKRVIKILDYLDDTVNERITIKDNDKINYDF